jgi:probable biosynthetic protein (TIGR04098 family)
MPHLGRNNLSEAALFRELAHVRWTALGRAGGVTTSRIRDEANERLYASVYWIELDLPRARPLSFYGENDRLEFQSDMSHHEKTYIDGVFRLPDGGWARMTNVFVFKEGGPQSLSVSAPDNLDYSKIPETAAVPDSIAMCRRAKRTSEPLLPPESGDMSLTAKESIHAIDPDRDLNGAGLVYFVNYLAFLDRAEREALGGLAKPAPDELMDERSTYRRRMAYFGNARSNDRLATSVTARARLVAQGGERFVDFSFDAALRRLSDGKTIALSSCRKLAPLLKPEALDWADSLLAAGAR